MSSSDDRATAYARSVVEGESPAGPLVLGLLAGCGDGSQDPSEMRLSERGQFSSLVSEVSQAATADEADRFEAVFAKGAAPPVGERSKYCLPIMFVLVGDPDISGDTATLTVNKVREDPVTEEREVIKELTWTGVKEDGAWKLKDVPLE